MTAIVYFRHAARQPMMMLRAAGYDAMPMMLPPLSPKAMILCRRRAPPARRSRAPARVTIERFLRVARFDARGILDSYLLRLRTYYASSSAATSPTMSCTMPTAHAYQQHDEPFVAFSHFYDEAMRHVAVLMMKQRRAGQQSSLLQPRAFRRHDSFAQRRRARERRCCWSSDFYAARARAQAIPLVEAARRRSPCHAPRASCG